MENLTKKALESIHNSINVSTGLNHSNDKNRVKEMFKRLHEAGEILLANEIEDWATSKGWRDKDAEELGALGQQISMGKAPKISDGPWWAEDILEKLESK